MFNEKIDRIERIVKNSYLGNESHIPSALSMVNYVYEVCKLIDQNNTNIVIGKPFGAISYYEVWKDLGWIAKEPHVLNFPSVLSDKHGNGFDFIDYSAETLGNSLGVATGYAITKDKPTWVNISDAALQMGCELEAILHISQLSKKGLPLLITVDNNNSQVTGETDDINSIQPVIEMIKSSNIEVVEYSDASSIHKDFKRSNNWDLGRVMKDAFDHDTPAVCIIFNTTKGYPIIRYVNDAPKYHYTTMDKFVYNDIMDELKQFKLLSI